MSTAGRDQSDLFGTAGPPSPRHRLFFALVPPEPVRARIADTARALRSAATLEGRWVRPERYHLTLAFLGDHLDLRPDLLHAARTAAAGLRAASFVWHADVVASFRGRQPPCVLRSSTGDAPLQAMHRQLRELLAWHWPDAPVERGFEPHVTLAYANRLLPAPLPVAPIAWTVDAMALLHGQAGVRDYAELGRWSLRG